MSDRSSALTLTATGVMGVAQVVQVSENLFEITADILTAGAVWVTVVCPVQERTRPRFPEY